MAIKIAPYKSGSRSAAALAACLGGRVLVPEPGRSRYNGRAGDTIINWGSSKNTWKWIGSEARVFNQPDILPTAINKRLFFAYLESRGYGCIPPCTTASSMAWHWANEGDRVIARTSLTGRGGDGIILIDPHTPVNNVPSAALYTKYIKKANEYRVHVFNEEGMYNARYVQRKARRLDVPDDQVNWRIRNYDNGFIYANQNVEAPQCVLDAARRCVELLGLDFGAVDVGYNESRDAPTVYEVNTAPGLEGQTLEVYTNYFTQY